MTEGNVEGHKDKKARTEEKYQLMYWQGIPGRGEPVRLAFEEAGVDYEDTGNFVNILTRGASKSPSSKSAHASHFAPPILQYGDIQISQLPNIMLYIGEKLKLVPDGEQSKFSVNQYFLTLADLQNEAHDTHHPIAGMQYYEDQKDAALLRSKDFRENRIPLFFNHFEAVLDHNKASNGQWLVGDSLTYEDLMLFHVVDGLKFAFPRCLSTVLPKYPKIAALYDDVKARPRISAYLSSKRRQEFSNGVYRKYDELDDPEE